MKTLKKGSRGEDVKYLSSLLGVIPEKTYFDDSLDMTVKAYQDMYGLVVDGIVGYKTWKSLMVKDRDKNHLSPGITDFDYILLGKLLDVDPDIIHAFVKVESGGSGFLKSGKPKILFEGHVFWKELQSVGISPLKFQPGNQDIIYKSWTTKYYKGGEAEWDRLERAIKIHKVAAQKSASWGILQVMGTNWKATGCKSLEEFIKEMSTSEFHQLLLGIEFIKTSGLVKYMATLDFKNLAKGYNGEGYAANKYDIKLKNAYFGLKTPKKN